MNSGYPNIKQSLELLVVLVASIMLLSTAWNAAGLPMTTLATGYLTTLGFVPPAMLVILKGRVRPESLLHPGRVAASYFLTIVPTAVGASFLLSEVDNLVRMVLPPGDFFRELLNSPLTGDPLAGALVLIVLAPVTEELLFRRVILDGLLRNYRPHTAVLLSSLLFAVFHFNPWQLLPTFLVALYLSWIYMRTRSYAACVVVHATFNAVPLVVVALLGLHIPGYTPSPAEAGPTFQPAWMDLAGIALVALGIRLGSRVLPTSSVQT